MSPRKPRLLLVGPRAAPGDPIGGTKVSFEALRERLRELGDFEVEVIDTSRRIAGASRLRKLAIDGRMFVRVLIDVLARAARCDVVMLNLSAGAAVRAGPFLWLAARVRGAPVCMRVFGGNFDLAYDGASPRRRRWVDRTVLASELVLLQTRSLCERFASRARVERFPTTRDVAAAVRAPRRCRRFLFLGQVRPEKGVLEALAASDRLHGDAVLDVIGPLMPGVDPRVFERHPRARFRGAVDPRDVAHALAQADALVFPTRYEGEGMPGVVVEALQSGRPVIASDWRAIAELVAHERNGLLIAPGSVDDLANAMQRLANDPRLYARLAAGARASGDALRSRPWTAKLARWLTMIAKRERVAAEPEAAPAPADAPIEQEVHS